MGILSDEEKGFVSLSCNSQWLVLDNFGLGKFFLTFRIDLSVEGQQSDLYTTFKIHFTGKAKFGNIFPA